MTAHTDFAAVSLDEETKAEFWFSTPDDNDAFEEAVRIARLSFPAKNIQQAYVLRREDTKVPEFLHMRLRSIELELGLNHQPSRPKIKRYGDERD